MAKRRTRKKNRLGSLGANCRCPQGAKRIKSKRGRGFVCARRVKDAPRFMKSLGSGRCPSGARKLKNGACLGKAPGWRFVKAVC